MSYVDDFGLKQSYGFLEAKESSALNKYGIKQIVVDVSGLVATASQKFEGAFIPKGSVIKGAYLVVSKAGTTPATTVDLGTCKADGTAIDADGLVDGATLAAGGKVGAGALVNAQVAEDSYICGLVSAAAGAAGLEGALIIDYV